MERIFKKSFRFVVDRYEEWENQQCQNQGDIDGEILAFVCGNKIIFKLKGFDDLAIEDTVEMDLSSPYTQMLESKGSVLINEDRIQYFGDVSHNPFHPHICQLFCEFGRVSYIRFAFPTPGASTFAPMTKRIYEFYGDMMELGEIASDTLQSFGIKDKSCTSYFSQTEKYVCQAMALVEQGLINSDDVYHLLYRAWREFKIDPNQLRKIQDEAKFGSGLLRFLLFDTIEDIDIKQQIASICYLFLSKALKNNPYDNQSMLNRLILIQHSREAFQYTVSTVVNEGKDWYSQTMFPFESRDALYKMEYADLLSNRRFKSIDILDSRITDLNDKIDNMFFGRKDAHEIIFEGKSLHDKVLSYLEDKVLDNLDVEF